MCLRINNIHLLISIFPSLEAHLLTITRQEVTRPVTAFGYISSDLGDHLSPFRHPVVGGGGGGGHTPSHFVGVGGHARSKVSRDLRGTLTGSSDHSIVPRGMCIPMHCLCMCVSMCLPMI